MKILVIKLSSLGDIVHTLPTVVAIKQTYPQAHITWLIDAKFAEILQNHPCIDKIIPFHKASIKETVKKLKIKKLLKYFYCLKKELYKEQFDISIDLQGSALSSLLVLLAAASIKLGNPQMKEASWLISTPIGKFDKRQHAVDRYLQVAKYLGCNTKEKKFLLDLSNISIEDKKILDSDKKNYKLIGLVISSRIKQKRWQVENYVQLIEELNEANLKFILFGDLQDQIIAEQILDKIKKNKRIIDLTGKTSLKELSYFISLCDVVVGSDSGPLHIAAALNKPVIGLYGPSSPATNAPYSDKAKVIYKNLSCSPCRIKPSCKEPQCMKLITPAEVIDLLKSIIYH